MAVVVAICSVVVVVVVIDVVVIAAVVFDPETHLSNLAHNNNINSNDSNKSVSNILSR